MEDSHANAAIGLMAKAAHYLAFKMPGNNAAPTVADLNSLSPKHESGKCIVSFPVLPLDQQTLLNC